MALDRKDFLLDDKGDLKIENGDFAVGDSNQQHVVHIFKSFQGEWKQNPLIGFGASRYLKKTTNKRQEFLRNLKLQLKFDSYENPEIDLTKGFDKIEVSI